jgi:hypothetical protein
MSLHIAPLAKTPLNDSFQPEERMVMGLAPDRQWLAFTQKMSQGPFEIFGSEAESKKAMFDPNGEFLFKYASRRAALEGNAKTYGTLTITPGR